MLAWGWGLVCIHTRPPTTTRHFPPLRMAGGQVFTSQVRLWWRELWLLPGRGRVK